jgi:hypothetical protein
MVDCIHQPVCLEKTVEHEQVGKDSSIHQEVSRDAAAVDTTSQQQAGAGLECADPADHAPAHLQAVTPFGIEETLIIFDWDDTILPSSWLSSSFQDTKFKAGDKVFWRHENDLMPEGTEGTVVACKDAPGLSVTVRFPKGTWLFDAVDLINCKELNIVAGLACETLRVAKEHGIVVLVTSSEQGWIERTCQKFLPTLYPQLDNVRLISARTSYASATAVLPAEWKLCAFENESKRVFGDRLQDPTKRKNIVSIGDGPDERHALLQLAGSLQNCLPKSLKLVEHPDVEQICKQHTLIQSASTESSTTMAALTC